MHWAPGKAEIINVPFWARTVSHQLLGNGLCSSDHASHHSTLRCLQPYVNPNWRALILPSGGNFGVHLSWVCLEGCDQAMRKPKCYHWVSVDSEEYVINITSYTLRLTLSSLSLIICSHTSYSHLLRQASASANETTKASNAFLNSWLVVWVRTFTLLHFLWHFFSTDYISIMNACLQMGFVLASSVSVTKPTSLTH